MMHKINTTVVLLFSILFCSMTQADNFSSQESTTDDYYYGQIDTIYSDELRLIIDDRSINFSSSSLFLDNRGETIIDINKSMNQDSYVKYHISPTSDSNFLLIDLKVISEEEFNDAKDRASAE